MYNIIEAVVLWVLGLTVAFAMLVACVITHTPVPATVLSVVVASLMFQFGVFAWRNRC